MLELRSNGRVEELGYDEVLDRFETSVVRWNNEVSGWDASGNFLTIREVRWPSDPKAVS